VQEQLHQTADRTSQLASTIKLDKSEVNGSKDALSSPDNSLATMRKTELASREDLEEELVRTETQEHELLLSRMHTVQDQLR